MARRLNIEVIIGVSSKSRSGKGTEGGNRRDVESEDRIELDSTFEIQNRLSGILATTGFFPPCVKSCRARLHTKRRKTTP